MWRMKCNESILLVASWHLWVILVTSSIPLPNQRSFFTLWIFIKPKNEIQWFLFPLAMSHHLHSALQFPVHVILVNANNIAILANRRNIEINGHFNRYGSTISTFHVRTLQIAHSRFLEPHSSRGLAFWISRPGMAPSWSGSNHKLIVSRIPTSKSIGCQVICEKWLWEMRGERVFRNGRHTVVVELMVILGTFCHRLDQNGNNFVHLLCWEMYLRLGSGDRFSWSALTWTLQDIVELESVARYVVLGLLGLAIIKRIGQN